MLAIVSPALALAAMILAQPRLPPLWASTLLAFLLVLVYPGYLLLAAVTGRFALGRSELATAFALSFSLWSLAAATLRWLGTDLAGFEWFLSVATTLVAVSAAARWVSLHPYRVSLAGSMPMDPIQAAQRQQHLWRRNWVPDSLFWGAALLVLSVFYHFASIWRPSDRWTYVGFLRQMLDATALGIDGLLPGLSVSARLDWPVWLAQMGVINRLSNTPLVAMYSLHLPPLLLFLALCSAYMLAQTLLGMRRMAALVVALLAVYWLADIALPAMRAFNWQERMLWRLDGGESTLGQWALLGRVIEDKFLLLFVLLPVIQSYLVRFLNRGGRQRLTVLALLIAGGAFAHPLGVAFVGISFAGYAGFRLIVKFGRTVLLRAAAVAVLVLLSAVIPFTQRLQLALDIPEAALWKLRGLDFIAAGPIRYGLWTTPLSDALFAAHPDLILRRGMLVASLLVLAALLVARGLRRPWSQFSAGIVGVELLVAFNPLVAPWLATVTTFAMLYRTYWLLVLPALIALAAAVQTTLAYVRLRSPRRAWVRTAAWVVPLVLPLLVAGLSYRTIGAGLNLLGEVQQAGLRTEAIDALQFLRYHAQPGSTILAEEWLSNEAPGMVGRVQLLAFRRWNELAPGGQQALVDFFASDDIDAGRLDVLQRFQVDYVIAPADGDIDRQLAHLAPGITLVYENPAHRVYELAPRWQQQPLLAQLLLAQSRLQEGDLAGAQAAAERAFALAPDSLLARQQLAAVAVQMGDFARALEIVEPLHAANPEQPWAARLLASVYSAQGAAAQARSATDEAVAAYKAALAADPTNLAAGKALLQIDAASARDLLTTAETASIVDAFTAAAAPAADRWSEQRREAYWELAKVYTLLGQTAEAEEAYRSAIALSRRGESEGEAYVQLGQFYARRGDTAAANATFQAGLARNPQDSRLYRALAELQMTLQNDPNAYHVIMEGAARLNPQAWWPYYYMGRQQLQSALTGQE